MIEPASFEKTFEALMERFNKKFSPETIALYNKTLSAALTTEEFIAAAEKSFVEDEFFPSPKRLIELARLLRPREYFSLPAGTEPAFEELTPEEQEEQKAAIAKVHLMLRGLNRSWAMPAAAPVEVSELARRRQWLSDPVLRKEALAWAMKHDGVEIITGATGEVIDLQEVRF